MPCPRATPYTLREAMAGFEIEEHTADVAVVATGADLGGALAWLAKGMFSIIAELEHVRPRETLEFSVSARDPESLAVDWLNEVLNRGASWAVDRGLGDPDDIEATEESGCMQDTGADAVGERPKTRGGPQLGTPARATTSSRSRWSTSFWTT